MKGSVSRRRFLSAVGSAAAGALLGCGDGETPTNPEPSDPRQETGPVTYVVEKKGSTIEARDKGAGKVVERGNSARRVIQAALDAAEPKDTVHIREGVYTIGPPRIRIETDNLEVKGDGPGNTVLKMAAEVNTEAAPLLGLQPEATGSTLRDLEISGNEAENRDIPPFPDSPPGHGLIVNGSKNTVENVYVHDTIRSNIVLNGKDCDLTDIELKNATTDHWLYITDGDNCSVRGVRASGFARTGGIVFGVGKKTCRNNTVSEVIIENTTTGPFEEELEGLHQYYPLQAITYRAGPHIKNNTVKNIKIRNPGHEAGHTIILLHAGATLQGLNYHGPIGRQPAFIRVGTSRDGASGAVVKESTIAVTEAIEKRATRPHVLRSTSSNVTFSSVEIRDAVGASIRGMAFIGEHRPIEDNMVERVTIESSGPAVVADGTDHPVTNIALADVTDVRCSGIETKGEVTFAEKDITCP